MNRQYLDPVFSAAIPRSCAEIFGEAWPEFPAADFDAIREPIDLLGVNYYTRSVMRHDAEVLAGARGAACASPALHTEMGWEVYPQGLTDILLWVKERYGAMPALHDRERRRLLRPADGGDGRVDDPLRVAYLRDHLRAAHAAIERGVDLRGYFAWSLLDNFEWSQGSPSASGIVHVDFETQKRTAKESARLYARIIASAGAALEA